MRYANPFNITVDQREDGSRWYQSPDGLTGPSVTTVLSLRPPWAPRFPQQAMDAVEYARQRGVELHRANALYAGAVPGQTLDWDSLDDDVRPRMEAIHQWKDVNYWETEHAELALFHPLYCFGGTVDDLGYLGATKTNRLTILDFKPPIAPLAGVQLSGYALLVKHAFNLDYVPGRISLHLDGKGPARENELNEHARDRDAFLNALGWFAYGHERKLW